MDSIAIRVPHPYYWQLFTDIYSRKVDSWFSNNTRDWTGDSDHHRQMRKMRMPGLPATPAAESMGIDDEGKIHWLF
jgi:hypothetical protein